MSESTWDKIKKKNVIWIGTGGRSIAGEGGRAKGRKLSEYNKFVKAHMASAKGSTPREKMSNVAKMWRERK